MSKGKHRAPKEPSTLGRTTIATTVALGSAAAGSVGVFTPAAAAPTSIVAEAPAFATPEEISSPAISTVSLEAETTYTVQTGDWLSTIAPRFGIGTADLYLANRDVVGGNPDLIFPGQVLAIAGSTTTGQHAQTGAQHQAAFQAPLETMPVTQAFKGEAHRGIDLGVPVGTPGYAVADGVVLFSRSASGFGLWTVIRSEIDGQTVDFVYGHLDHLLVSEGDVVSVGDHIIDTGNNGISTGPHLHFEVWIGGRVGGHTVDPVAWLAARGVAL